MEGMFSPEMLVGQEESHLTSGEEVALLGAPVNRSMVPHFKGLVSEAARAGYDLRILSGYRSFERQLSIWNRKASGQLAVLDADARPMDIAVLSERELTLAILRWSALPGASRHHWGTDIDVYDAAAVPPDYQVELVPAEVNPDGPFGPMHAWLDERIAQGTSLGFYRPYDRDRGGVAPERWHLSYSPISRFCLSHLTKELLRDTIARAEMCLKESVLADLDEIYERFVVNVNPGLPDESLVDHARTGPSA